MKPDEIYSLANEWANQTIERKLDRVYRVLFKAWGSNLYYVLVNGFPLDGGREVSLATEHLTITFGQIINDRLTYIVYMNER